MKTIEQVNKIEAVVLYVLQNFKNGVDYIKLFKIIYFAQRDYLASYGKELCPDTFRARNFGPVPSLSDKVIKLVEFQTDINEEYPDLKRFANSIRIENQLVYGKKKPNLDYLSVIERECLDKWYLYCKDKDSIKELSPESHDKAYRKALKRGKKDPQLDMLTSIEIAEAGGASPKMLEYIRCKELLTADLA